MVPEQVPPPASANSPVTVGVTAAEATSPVLVTTKAWFPLVWPAITLPKSWLSGAMVKAAGL